MNSQRRFVVSRRGHAGRAVVEESVMEDINELVAAADSGDRGSLLIAVGKIAEIVEKQNARIAALESSASKCWQAIGYTEAVIEDCICNPSVVARRLPDALKRRVMITAKKLMSQYDESSVIPFPSDWPRPAFALGQQAKYRGWDYDDKSEMIVGVQFVTYQHSPSGWLYTLESSAQYQENELIPA